MQHQELSAPLALRSPGSAAAAPHSTLAEWLETITLSRSILHGITGEVGASIPPAAGPLASFITCGDSPQHPLKMDPRARAMFPGSALSHLVTRAGLKHGERGPGLCRTGQRALFEAQAQLAWGIAHTLAPSKLQPILQILSEILEISELRDVGTKPHSHPASTGHLMTPCFTGRHSVACPGRVK